VEVALNSNNHIFMSSSNLRDVLLNALISLPGTREFHIHVLVSSPRKNNSLFPFALPRPKVYLQDVLILLSEQRTPDSPRILVTAIEACVYNVPATSCAILYVSKVDSTGQASAPSPTPTLVKTFLTYYADLTTRPIAAAHLWIQLFARAQNQYLFPNSSEYEGKKPLSDIRLCSWWRRVFSDVATQTLALNKEFEKPRIGCYHVLPGLNELDALQAMKVPLMTSNPTLPSWVYGHPYCQKEMPLPCPLEALNENQNLGNYIPWFDDDPKSRFLDEIAYTTETDVKSPVRKRARTASRSDGAHAQIKGTEQGDEEKKKEVEVPGDLRKVTPDEFWERMSFRQECVAGAVTGFFTVIVSPPASKSSEKTQSEVSPLAPQAGQVSSQINKRVLTSLTTGVEFSTRERAIRGTEIVEGAIKGLCDGIPAVPTIATTARPRRTSSSADLHHYEDGRRTPERSPPPPPIAGSLLAPPRTPPPRITSGKRIVPTDISPNPFPEPVTSLETYTQHIYGSISVSNADVSAKRTDGAENKTDDGQNGLGGERHVTVLKARKKKKN
jgi:regulator of Ty1 transposition protein 109